MWIVGKEIKANKGVVLSEHIHVDIWVSKEAVGSQTLIGPGVPLIMAPLPLLGVLRKYCGLDPLMVIEGGFMPRPPLVGVLLPSPLGGKAG